MNDSSMQNFSITSNNGEAYWKRSVGFLIIGIIGILANAFVIVILGSSAKIRQKLVNTLIIHQSFVDFLTSIALVGTAHFSPYDSHGLGRTPCCCLLLLCNEQMALVVPGIYF